jgi:hypothetical protein
MNFGNAWNEMIDEFRALGGVAQNVRLGHGPLGRALFPIEPSKPIDIRIPEDLLVPLDDVVIENNIFRISPASAVNDRVRAFVEAYERDFAWGQGRLEVERFFGAMNELPEQLRIMLTAKFGFGRFFDSISPKMVERWFFGTRDIKFGDRRVIMPIIEMANHGGTADYDTQSGVALFGSFDGEVLVRYCTPTDPFDVFLNGCSHPKSPWRSASASLRPMREGRSRSAAISPGTIRNSQASRLRTIELWWTICCLAVSSIHASPKEPFGSLRPSIFPIRTRPLILSSLPTGRASSSC